jgi:hypothetical protein
MSKKKPNKEGRAKAARPTSRLLCPRPPLGSSTKEMDGRAGVEVDGRPTRARPPSPDGDGGRRADFFGANSVASALGIRHGRDPAADKRWARLPATPELELQRRPPFRDPEAPVSTKLSTRSPTRRILVSLGRLLPSLRKLLRSDRLGCPCLRRDLSQIDFRLRQGGNASRVRLLFYVTQRDDFRLLS